MTDRLRAAAQAALGALERARAYVYETDRPKVDASMDALRAALAEQDAPYADKAKQFSGTQLRIDPVTGNVGIGTVALTEPTCKDDLQDAEPDEIGPEWTPCVKRPVTVHVRSQRVGEKHVSTREGITPVKPDDLIMRGVDGEEYPIGRSLFDRTYLVGVGRVKQAALSMHGKSIESAEPVAWLIPGSVTRDADLAAANGTNAVPLYAHPPRSEWQSLTDEEMYAAYESAPTRWDRHIRGLRTIEAALKEKNT